MLQPYAHITNNEITGIEFHDPATYTGSLLLLAGIDPMPWVGWTTDGTTWTAPVITPTPQDQAQAAIQQLAANVPAMKDQITTDANLFAGTAVGSTLTQGHLDALVRVVNGFSTVLDAIASHATFTGALPS